MTPSAPSSCTWVPWLTPSSVAAPTPAVRPKSSSPSRPNRPKAEPKRLGSKKGARPPFGHLRISGARRGGCQVTEPITEDSNMAEITAALVKELRERTGQGMMECKKALVAAGGDIEKAIDDMRASGAIKAAKKAGNIAAEGAIAVRVEGGRGLIIEVNSQTDFLALQDDFKGFVKDSLDEAFEQNLTDAAPLVASRESAREALVAKCGENVNIRRLSAVSGETVGAYLHGHRIGVLVVLKGGNDELAKHVAMHVAASNPAVVSPDQVSEELVAKEKEIFL